VDGGGRKADIGRRISDFLTTLEAWQASNA
jgi:hypothetical protein